MRKTFTIMLLVVGMFTGKATISKAIYTNVWISSDTNPSNAGQLITLTGQVIAPCTGTITFLDGTTQIGTAPINTGYATFQVSNFASGTHSLTASYSGSGACNPGVSSALNQVVNSPAPAITSLSLSQGPPQVGLTITGTNFGATQGNSTVTINGMNATVIPGGWSATSIDVQVPATTSGNGGSEKGSGAFYSRQAIKRSRPYGSEKWTAKAVRQFGLESTTRSRARPPKGS